MTASINNGLSVHLEYDDCVKIGSDFFLEVYMNNNDEDQSVLLEACVFQCWNGFLFETDGAQTVLTDGVFSVTSFVSN